MSKAAAPAFVAHGVGTIVDISSAVTIAVEALNGLYGASKADLLAFGQSLQNDR